MKKTLKTELKAFLEKIKNVEIEEQDTVLNILNDFGKKIEAFDEDQPTVIKALSALAENISVEEATNETPTNESGTNVPPVDNGTEQPPVDNGTTETPTNETPTNENGTEEPPVNNGTEEPPVNENGGEEPPVENPGAE